MHAFQFFPKAKKVISLFERHWMIADSTQTCFLHRPHLLFFLDAKVVDFFVLWSRGDVVAEGRLLARDPHCVILIRKKKWFRNSQKSSQVDLVLEENNNQKS